jgi:hypothetical protein
MTIKTLRTAAGWLDNASAVAIVALGVAIAGASLVLGG